MFHQGATPRRADAVHVIERIGTDGLGSLSAVGANGKPVGFIAQALNEIQNRITRFEHERQRPARNMEMFTPGIAVRTLGNAGKRDVRHTQFGHDLARDRQLTRTAIDQHEIGTRWKIRFEVSPSGAVAFSRPGQPLESARQHLTHHGVVVSGRHAIGLDIELAIGIFDKAFRPSNDHTADGVRTGNMTVVVDLDAAWRGVKAEAFTKRLQQLGLRRAFSQLAAKRFLGITQRVLDQARFGATLRHQNFNLAFGLDRERLRHQRAF